jgi:hypothetical protein
MSTFATTSGPLLGFEVPGALGGDEQIPMRALVELRECCSRNAIWRGDHAVLNNP